MFEKFCRAPAPATAPNRAKFGKHCGATGSKDMRAFKARQRIPFGGSVPPRAPFPGPQNDVKKASKTPQKGDKKERNKHKKNTPKSQKNCKKTPKIPKKYSNKYRQKSARISQKTQKKTPKKMSKIGVN